MEEKIRNTSSLQDSEIVRIFNEMNSKANEVNPGFESLIESFNDANVSFNYYQQLAMDQNRIVDTTTSSHISTDRAN
jgi:hypothetical protein